MVSMIVRLRFTSEDHHEMTEVLEQLATASRREPGCVSYVPHWSDDDSNTVVIYEQYKDSAALEAHRQTPHFKQYAISGLYQKMKERNIESLTAVV
jgi:quinol monooxygenase YgiN